MTTSPPVDTQRIETENQRNLVVGKRRRVVREAIVAYLFLLPAALATFIFGLWPVISGFYESLKSGSPITNKYVGLANYLRALGSFTYILLFALSLVFIAVGYFSWSGMKRQQETRGGSPWHFIVPGLLAGTMLVVASFNFVTGSSAYEWLPIVLLAASTAGFFTAEWIQLSPEERSNTDLASCWGLMLLASGVWVLGPDLLPGGTLKIVGGIVLVAILAGIVYLALPHLRRIHSWHYVTGSIIMGLMLLVAVLLSEFTLNQMENTTDQARDITSAIFNPEMANVQVPVNAEGVTLDGLVLDGEVMVQVKVGGETIEAPLAPEAYQGIDADRLTYLRTALSNNAKVMVTLPDGSTVEGILTGLEMGQKFEFGLTADDLVIQQEAPLYLALDIGPEVIRNSGHTEPVSRQFLAALLVFIGIASIYLVTWTRNKIDDDVSSAAHSRLYWLRVFFVVAILMALFYLVGAIELNRQASAAMRSLTEDQFKRAYQYVFDVRPPAGLRAEVLAARLMYWPQVFLVTIGATLIGIAYFVWQGAQRRESKLGFSGSILLAITLMVGGWLMLSELPQSIDMAGREAGDTMDALTRTALYAIGTVPIQLGLGLFLAYLLFSEITWGKSLYRVIYFMPYIAPTVATSTVFLVIFRPTEASLANQFLGIFGIEPLLWLKEPDGVVRIGYELLGGNPLNIPEGFQGPSLALFTVILYNIWVFAGYNSVIFLAGLGAIPGELYEAAEVDGAGRWSRFRNITLPLLSPTTFFLSMLSIIGTFKAFSHIYVLRNQATGKEVDTMSVHIFNQLYSANDPGYAAALAFVLFGVILVLTVVQNQLAKKQVFYG